MRLPQQIDVRAAETVQGLEIGPGPWHEVTQHQIDQFAQCTGDDQWIHVDVERATAGPYGGTIAHGFLTLSLLPAFLKDLIEWTHRSMGVNYGLDKIRFLAPVRAGSRVRGRTVIAAVSTRPDGTVLVTQDLTIEIEGSQRPACIARQLILMRAAGSAEPAAPVHDKK